MYVTMDQGSTLERTDLLVSEIETQLEDLKEKEEIISQIYEEEAVVTVKLFEDFDKIDGRSMLAIKEEAEDRVEDISGGEIDFQEPMTTGSRFGGGGGRNPGADFERMLGIGQAEEKIVIKGRNFERMRNFADEINEYLEDLDSINRTRVSASSDRTEVHLYFDQLLILLDSLQRKVYEQLLMPLTRHCF